MRTRGRSRAAALAVTMALAAGGCGGDDGAGDVGPREDPSGSESAPSGGSGTIDDPYAPDRRDGAGGGGHPCDVVDVPALEALTGMALGAGDALHAGDVENGVRWSATACEWEIEEQIELELHLVRADDYESGEVVCPGMSETVATVVDVTGLGESAQWSYDDFSALGELRACTANGMVTAAIDVEGAGPFDEATLRSIATVMVEPTLALL